MPAHRSPSRKVSKASPPGVVEELMRKHMSRWVCPNESCSNSKSNKTWSTIPHSKKCDKCRAWLKVVCDICKMTVNLRKRHFHSKHHQNNLKLRSPDDYARLSQLPQSPSPMTGKRQAEGDDDNWAPSIKRQKTVAAIPTLAEESSTIARRHHGPTSPRPLRSSARLAAKKCIPTDSQVSPRPALESLAIIPVIGSVSPPIPKPTSSFKNLTSAKTLDYGHTGTNSTNGDPLPYYLHPVHLEYLKRELQRRSGPSYSRPLKSDPTSCAHESPDSCLEASAKSRPLSDSAMASLPVSLREPPEPLYLTYTDTPIKKEPTFPTISALPPPLRAESIQETPLPQSTQSPDSRDRLVSSSEELVFDNLPDSPDGEDYF